MSRLGIDTCFLCVVVMYTHCIALMAGMEHSGIDYSDHMRCRAADGSNTLCYISRHCIATGYNARKFWL